MKLRNPVAGAGHAVLAGMMLWFLPGGVVPADSVEKILFLVDEGEELVAANTATGQFFRLKLSARETVERRITTNACAVLVTSQRFIGVGSWPSGWASLRRSAGEQLVSAEAEDHSAVLVTSSRMLSFNGRTGSWSETPR
jgi:hypothetical protein